MDAGQTRPRRAPSAGTRTARAVYTVCAWLFAAGVVTQVFFAGMGVLVDPAYFGWHTSFAHFIESVLMLMLVVGAIGRVGWGVIGLNLLLFGLFTLQYVFLYALAGPPRALHVVNALALFWFAIYLGKRSWYVARRPRPSAMPATGAVAELAGSSEPASGAAGKGMSAGQLVIGVVVILLGAVVLFGIIFDVGGRIFVSGPPGGSPGQSVQTAFPGDSSPLPENAQGAQLFAQNCAGCHGENGGGGFGPALAGNDGLEDSARVIEQILGGGGGMPAFGKRLSAEELAAVASHIRESWGNDFGPVAVEEVAARR